MDFYLNALAEQKRVSVPIRGGPASNSFRVARHPARAATYRIEWAWAGELGEAGVKVRLPVNCSDRRLLSESIPTAIASYLPDLCAS